MGIDIGSLLGSSLGDAIAKVVGSFKLDPTVAAQLQEQLQANAQELNKIQLQNEAKAFDDASANIQADAKANWYAAGARPTFLYIIELILLWNYFIGPVFHRTPIALPGDLLTLFGVCVCGYISARTYEKVNGGTD